MRAHPLEQREQVVDERHQVGEDDVVERLAQVERLARRDLEAQVRMSFPRECDERGAEVDPDSRAGSSAASRSPPPAPTSSTLAPGWNVEAHDALDQA